MHQRRFTTVIHMVRRFLCIFMSSSRCERSLPSPHRGIHAGSYKMPRVSLIMHRFNYAGSVYNIHTKGLFNGRCPGVQGHEDLMQVQFTQCRFLFQNRRRVGACSFPKKRPKRHCKRSRRNQNVMISTSLLLNQTWDHIPWKNMLSWDPRYNPLPLRERHPQNSMN